MAGEMEGAILEVASSIFEMMLGLPAEAATGLASDRSNELVAEIRITGAFEGRVRWGCSTRFARHAASIIFGSDAAGPDLEEAALVELTNMAGGNMKALLAGPSRLALPTVLHAVPDPASADEQQLASVELRCAGEPVVVTLFERFPRH